MKKKYIQPTTKAVKVSIESHIATLSGGGNDTVNGTLDSSVNGDGGDDVLGKEDNGQFGW